MTMRRDAYWTAAETLVSSGFAFLLRLVVARILAPEDFGVAALAVTVVSILQTVNDFGLTAALIQRDEKDVTRDFVDTTFTASLAVTVAIAALAGLVVAPLAASAYGEPQLHGLILALSVTLLPSPFTTVAAALLLRQRRFRATALIKVVSTLVGMAAAVAVLVVHPSAWVIIAQVAASALCSAALFQIAQPRRYRLRLDRTHLRSALGFSGFVLLTDLIGNLQANAGVFVIGLVLATDDVGRFALALYLTDTARRLTMSILNRVTFVHFSQNKHDQRFLRETFASTVRWNCRALFPLMTSMMLFGPAWAPRLFGPEWEAAGPVIFWLSLTVIVGTAGGTTSNLFKSVGRPGLDLSLAVLTTVLILFPALYLSARGHGLAGAAIAIFSVKLFAVALRLAVLQRVVPGAPAGALRRAAEQIALQLPILGAWLASRALGLDGTLYEVALLVAALGVYAAVELPRTFRAEWRGGRRWVGSLLPRWRGA